MRTPSNDYGLDLPHCQQADHRPQSTSVCGRSRRPLSIGTIPQVAGERAGTAQNKASILFNVDWPSASAQISPVSYVSSPAVVPLITLLIIWTSLWNLPLEAQISLPNASGGAGGSRSRRRYWVLRYYRSAGRRAPAKDRLTSRNGGVINPPARHRILAWKAPVPAILGRAGRQNISRGNPPRCRSEPVFRPPSRSPEPR